MYSNLKKGYFKYQQTDVMSLPAEKIVERLLNAMLSDVERAAYYMKNGDVAKKGERLSRAIAIAGELQASLNFKEGGEIAERLDALYDYMIRELLMANLKNDIKKLGNVKSALMPIIEAWQGVVQQNSNHASAVRQEVGDSIGQLQTAL